MDRRDHKRSLRNLLLDRRFQLKYAGAIALSGGLIFGGLGLMVDQQVRHNTELTALDTPADPFEAELQSRLAAEDAELRWTLLLFWLAVVLLLFAVGIAATHRIVGPVYVVERHLAELAAGQRLDMRPLRQGDEFQRLFSRVAALAQQLEAGRSADAERIERAVSALTGRLARAEGPLTAQEVMAWVEADLAELQAVAAERRGAAEPST